MSPLKSSRTGPLAGDIRVPGDKSISHRALMLGALAVGETRVHGLLAADDTLRTAAALRAMGAAIARRDDGVWSIHGVGVGGLAEPDDVLDLGNSGTSARLLSGLLASHPLTAFFTGDASLRRRPMGRVVEPLTQMGAAFVSRRGDRLPMAIIGTEAAMAIEYRLPVPSAQVKSAVLLAGLNATGRTTVIEPQPTRDHSERMLAHFGADIRTRPDGDGQHVITVAGWPEMTGREVVVPGDFSAAAFPMAAAAIRPDSVVVLRDVGVNPRRTGLLDTLQEMGADIAVGPQRDVGGEPVADLTVRGAALKGVDVPAARAPRMIDEYPILAIAAACAEGQTRMTGLAELRVKESDRLTAIARGLAACGVGVETSEDGLVVHGTGHPPAGSASVATALDHRIAMSFLVLGMASAAPVAIDDGAPIETSFPGFVALMNRLGGHLGPPS